MTHIRQISLMVHCVSNNAHVYDQYVKLIASYFTLI